MARIKHKGKQAPTRGERYSDARYAWATMPKFEVVIYHGDDLDDGAEALDESGKDDLPHLGVKPVRVMFKYPSKRMSFNMTAWTEKELDAFAEMVNHAIDCARPAVQALDKRAEEEFQEGGDDNPRLFRPDPMVMYRERFRPDYGHLVENGYTVTSPIESDSQSQEPDNDQHEEDGGC